MGSEEGSFSGSESAESASSTGFGMKLVSCLSIMRASSPGEAGPPEPNRLQGQHSRSQGKLLPGCTFQVSTSMKVSSQHCSITACQIGFMYQSSAICRPAMCVLFTEHAMAGWSQLLVGCSSSTLQQTCAVHWYAASSDVVVFISHVAQPISICLCLLPQRRLVGQDPDTCTMCWDECDATVYQIRSQDYMRTKVKQCSSKAFYRLVAMDLFAAETKAYHVAKQFALPVTGEAKWLLASLL